MSDSIVAEVVRLQRENAELREQRDIARRDAERAERRIAELEGELREMRVKAFEEAASLCDGKALIWHVIDPNNEAGLSAESGAAQCADLIRLKAEAVTHPPSSDAASASPVPPAQAQRRG